MVRWHIRAQNAADSAASAGIATDANMNNEVTTLIYAATVEETRLRFLLQAMANLVYDPATCTGTTACDAALTKLSAAYTVAAANYAAITVQMSNIDTLSRGGLTNSPATAAGMAPTHCAVLDCGFTYTTTIDSAHETVDVVACKNVATLYPEDSGAHHHQHLQGGRPQRRDAGVDSRNLLTGFEQPVDRSTVPAGGEPRRRKHVGRPGRQLSNTDGAADLVRRRCDAAQGARRSVRLLMMRQRQRGQALIETVVFLPVALIAIFGVMYFSRYGVLSERAQSAVRYGALVSYQAAPVYSARGIYDAIATGPVAPTACPAAVGTDTVKAISEQNGGGPTPSPYWRPDSATATCMQSTMSFAGAPTAAFHIFTVTASTATATIAVPTVLSSVLGTNASAVASFGYVRSDPPGVIMYCIPTLGPAVAAALGRTYGVGGAC